MERSFRHPQRMYHGREAGPWFTGAGIPHENSWAGRPLPEWSQDYQDPQWDQDPQWGQGPPDPQWGQGPPDPQWDQGPPDPQWGQGPPDPQWGQGLPDPQWGQNPPDPQWGHPNPRWGQDLQNSQCYPDQQWDQYHPERPSRDYGWGSDNGRFLHQGSNSYRRRSHGRVYGKRSSSFYKGPKSCSLKGKNSSHSSSRILVEMQQRKKENDSEVKEDESAIPKETKKAQEDSVASVENTDPPQVSQEASKAIISPSQFSFRLPPDSLTGPVCSPAKTEDTEMVSQEASKAIISPSQFSFRLPPESLTCPAKTEDIELIKPGTGSKTEDSHQVASCTQAATSELPATLENLELKKEDKEIDLDKLKGTQATKAQPREATSLPSAKSHMEGQAPSNTAKSFHPVVNEEPMLVPETKQDMNIVTLTDPSSVTELSTPSCVVEPPPRLETKEALLSLGREEDELLESSQSTDHFDRIDSPPAVEIPFPSDTTDECQSEGKEDLELTQMGSSHEDTDCSQACDALAGGTSALPVIPNDVHSVPVLVRGKETEQPYFWESESSLRAPEFNWSDGGKGWAPEDYQEPSWALDKTKKCGDVSEPERNLVRSHSSFHSRYSSDRSPDTGSVLERRSSSSRSRHTSDSKHSSTERTIKCLRSPLRQGSHSRSPLRRRWRSRSPLRQDRSHSRDSSRSSGGREITRTDYCSKCHCKCCQNPSQKRFQERVLPHSYSTHKMHRYHPSKETSKSYRTSHSYSPQNSTMKSQTTKKKSTRHEETKRERSASVKQKGRLTSVKRKGRSTSVKQVKSSKVTLNGRKVLAPINHDAALAVETSIPAETTEHFQSANTEVYESVQLAPSSEDTGFAHQSCARKETGTSAPSRIVEDPRSVAVLTKTNQIEQDYLQVMLNFAVVATMLLQKEPCMEQALEVALRANMRSVGDYYESMLKNFIDNYDVSETH